MGGAGWGGTRKEIKGEEQEGNLIVKADEVRSR